MLLHLLIALASSLPGPVQGDFDHDGLLDTARIGQSSANVYHLEITRGAEPGVSHRLPLAGGAPDYLGLATARRGVATACGRGLGVGTQPCPNPKVDLRQGDLLFGHAESAEAAILWDGGTFRIEWLTD